MEPLLNNAMKFAVGYQLAEEGNEPFAELVRDYRDQLAEVYFPWGDLPSGRAALVSRRGYVNWEAQERLEADLQAFRAIGLKLDLLINANCYGARAISRQLENWVASILEHLDDKVGGVDIVTTASLAVAHIIKRHFPKMEVRASVNMRIGTSRAMAYVSDLFDSFYVQRDYNRDLDHLRDVKAWADQHGQGLYLLVNSGCLRLCPGQTFHDNLVAHDSEIDETVNLTDWTPHVCWNLYRNQAAWPAILQATWIRPEDMGHYEALFPVVKLAMRMHSRPRLVLQAYSSRRHHGNILDLLEPGLAPAFSPYIVNNDRFPADWFERTSACRHDCERCDYCPKVLRRVLTRMESE